MPAIFIFTPIISYKIEFVKPPSFCTLGFSRRFYAWITDRADTEHFLEMSGFWRWSDFQVTKFSAENTTNWSGVDIFKFLSFF